MEVVITASFLKRELKIVQKVYGLVDILKTVQKVTGRTIKMSQLGYKGGELMKLRMVHKVAGRLIVYVYKNNAKVVPILVRLKKDKVFGENLALNNKKAKHTILKALDNTMNDIRGGEYEVYNP